MSRFFSGKFASLIPYTPGEQPSDQQYIQLNTNENPFPPAKAVVDAIKKEAERLQLYPDPECRELRETLANQLDLKPEQLLMTNGSDEILYYAFMAFCDADRQALFPDITYGFYPVYAAINHVPFQEIPLQDNWKICLEDYAGVRGTLFLANPNAPTGIALDRDQVEWLLRKRPDDLLVVDEAYVDFGAESCLPLIRKYDRLLVCQTYSKSRSMAGARLGFGAGNAELIRDLNTIKYSINPYTINRMTAAAGMASILNEDLNRENSRIIIRNRDWTAAALRRLGFEMTESKTNFLFARHPEISGEELYRELKKRGILIRHFNLDRIRDYNRITIGTGEQMEKLVLETEYILRNRRKDQQDLPQGN